MILVTGAIGTIGSAVIQHLVTQNAPVRALVREFVQNSNYWSCGQMGEVQQ
jgi:uncharacterized protein YbjT (DUF2867 family)